MWQMLVNKLGTTYLLTVDDIASSGKAAGKDIIIIIIITIPYNY